MEEVKKILRLSLILFILLFPFKGTRAFAWPEGLTLQPAKTEVSLSSGENFSSSVRIINNQPVDLFIEVSAEELSIWDDSKEIYPLSPSEDYLPQNFIKPAYDSFYIEAGEEFILPVDISLPDSLPSGGYYGTLIFSATPANESLSQTKVITRLGSVFLIRFDGGDIKEEGKVVGLSLDDNKRIVTKLPEYFKVIFENSGNVHLNPAGRIEVFRFGQLVGEVPVGIFPAYPGLENRTKAFWSVADGFNFSEFGFYNARLRMYLGYGEEYQEVKTYFIVIPKVLSLFILSILGLVVFGLSFKSIVKLIRGLK